MATPIFAQHRYEVINAGESVEVRSVPEAPPPSPKELEAQSFFSDVPPLVIASTWSVADLAQAWTFAAREADRVRLLERLGQTKARSDSDLRWLMNLYGRGDPAARAKVEASVALLGPAEAVAAPFFELLLEDEDPKLQALGLAGAARLRSPRSLKLIRALAEKPFSVPEPTLAMSPIDANRWGLQFAALGVLAAWQGPKVLPLILKRAQESPIVAELAAAHFWTEGFDRYVAWSESKKPADQARAARAWAAPAPLEALRATKGKLWALLFSKRRPETRHRAAIKLGLVCDDVDLDRLLAERAKAAPSERPLLDTALFASRSAKAVPILLSYAKEAPDPLARAGALFQLRSALPREEYRALLKWVTEHDADRENRANAAAELVVP
ncbi:MAG: hypothetical protein HYZ75_02715 [Elusimicrobia bacterium]|nr:hypothetical protein [Elusimicrobiota bacterium]